MDEASSIRSLLGPGRRRRTSATTTTASYPLLATVALISLLLGALASSAVRVLASHVRAASPATAHRNDNTLASPSHDPDSPPVSFLHPAPCGATPSEARAAGCLFDLVSFNWLPPPCHDAELAAQFEAELRDADQLAWYENERRTRSLSRNQVAAGDRSGVYVSPGYHLRHCTAMWRRMHRALMLGGGGLGRLDGYIWSYHHTRHCEETLLAGGERNGTGAGERFTTEVRIKYPDCGVVLEGNT
ncbi:hypothetical protein CGRA01v4_04085 [Colletotrichum graminicola]|uniref:Uncharacterized protein n=1 Tax=Colletotrichum graminicola (strain M1.001 / M2 / FGSC 10212) TaxID=645133 RepID=E3QXL7_COLGM|nr:uncharacterized protein GLRG_10749 [Colletotrichum graminicola M1.001]EFQ35605.1 hypothetical protein GLRG_10749 [Colletotrichum graminicola M1.001]WDK12804.1 hypothetical protein CGRA01v4_04085 [Colletotrichum graminicola]